MDAVSGMMVLRQSPLPEDIKTLGVEGVNQIWRDAKLRAVGLKRAKTLLSAAEHSIGSQEGLTAARMEIKNLLNEHEVYSKRVADILMLIEELLREIPFIDKLMAIDGVGLRTAISACDAMKYP